MIKKSATSSGSIYTNNIVNKQIEISVNIDKGYVKETYKVHCMNEMR